MTLLKNFRFWILFHFPMYALFIENKKWEWFNISNVLVIGIELGLGHSCRYCFISYCTTVFLCMNTPVYTQVTGHTDQPSVKPYLSCSRRKYTTGLRSSHSLAKITTTVYCFLAAITWRQALEAAIERSGFYRSRVSLTSLLMWSAWELINLPPSEVGPIRILSLTMEQTRIPGSEHIWTYIPRIYLVEKIIIK